MDTEEDVEIKEAIHKGLPETDEGPYYHEPWWESYKGSVKGKLGGALVGALVGGVVGGLAFLVLPLVAVTTGISAVAMIGSFAAAGMIYGSHEFSDIGKNVGSGAAMAEKLEQRITSFEDGKFSEIQKEIGEIKSALGVKKSAAAATEKPVNSSMEYRMRHSDEHPLPGPRKWVFWKIALIGLVAGAAAGALLGATGIAAEILNALGAKVGEGLAQSATLTASTSVVMGLFGASFGINRDMFRRIFDKTDLLFKGLLKSVHVPQKQMSVSKTQEPAQTTEIPKTTGIATIVYDGLVEYPKSDTYHRDRAHAQARQALLSMDTTNRTPH